MKNLFKTIITLSIGLASCQQENVVVPAETTESIAANLRESALPGIPKNYQLIRHGDIKLSYSQAGKLEKISYSPLGQRGLSPTYMSYKYGAQKITATLYYDSKVAQVSTYLLDNAGRCYESLQLDYVPYGPNTYQVNESNFTYLYNSKGQLVTRTNKKLANEKTTFIWDAAGDLTKMTGYNFRDGKAYESVAAENTLYYDQPTGDPVLADLSPINCEAANLPDPYLPIFGKQSKHLVKLITEKSTLGGKYYNYTLNADGYVTKRQAYELSGAVLLETKAYDYLVTEVVLHL